MTSAAPGQTSVAYLGPAGTFTEVALNQLTAGEQIVGIPKPAVDDVLSAVRDGSVGSGVVPIENSLEGPVTMTIDALSRGEQPLMIVAEDVVPVKFALVARPGTALSDITRVSTIPIAYAQCAQWVADNLPSVTFVPTSSTARSAEELGNTPDPGFDAAICPAIAAEHYGLEVLADGIGDNPDAITRFVRVSQPTVPPEATGADKTTLVLFMRQDHPGALLEILTEFAVRGVNLTRIESRPTRRQLGDYYFSVDCEGHVNDARVGEALTGLRRVCSEVRFLGSYPRHDGKQPTVRSGTSDDDFQLAADWLAAIRNV